VGGDEGRQVLVTYAIDRVGKGVGGGRGGGEKERT